jgi:polysaccharide pyruvyl transferase WcaK-like protein
MKPIKICHLSFNPKKNKGDEAIVLGIKQELERVFTNQGIVYQRKDLYFLKPLKYPKYVDNKLWKKIFTNFEAESFWQKLGLDNFLRQKQLRNKAELINQINSADLVVVGGGGVYYGGLLPFDDDLINKITKPIVVFSAGYNQLLNIPFLGEAEKASIINLNKKTTLSSVRDKHTLQLLQSLGCQNIELVPDPALVLKQELVSNQYFDLNFFHLGLNISMHSPMLAKKLQSFPKAYLDFINFLISKKPKLKHQLDQKLEHGLILHLFVHTQNELDFGIYLLQNLSKNQNLKLKIHNTDPKKLKWLYSQTDFNITMMLHSAVFAFCANKPFLNLGYDVKNQAFMDLVGLKNNYLDLISDSNQQDISLQIQTKFLEIINNQSDHNSNKTASKLVELQTQIYTFSDKIAKLSI